ncbi:hypothetical protein PG985_005672 [Apiospora marii]|uniref:uncharacterized protein n=1 Tax=Apiospora marii TaxID=335849 RepID=UPI00312E8E08
MRNAADGKLRQSPVGPAARRRLRCEGDATTISRRLRQAVSSPEDSSNRDELKVIEGFLLNLQDVPEEEIAGLLKPVRPGEALSEVDSLRNEIELLRRRLHHNETVLSAVTKPRLQEGVLVRLCNAQSIEQVSKWLEDTVASGDVFSPAAVDDGPAPSEPRTSQRMDAISCLSTWSADNAAEAKGTETPDQEDAVLAGSHDQNESTGTDFPPEVLMWTANMASYFRVSPQILSEQMQQGTTSHGFMRHMSVPVPMAGMNMLPATWTSVTQDMNRVQHLLALYFCWEYPIFATIHKEYFLADFLSGRQRYCSAGLVNAILALGESFQLAAQASTQYSLVNIQALGILSLRELRCGRDPESRYYAEQSMRLAVEMGLNKVDHGEEEGYVAVSTTTFWGSFILDNTWTLVTGMLPLTSRAPLLPSKPPIHPDIEASPWTPYPNEDAKSMQHRFEQVSNTQSVFRCFCEISQLGHNAAYFLQTPNNPVTGYMLLDAYNQYLDWYSSISEALRLGTNFTPPVFLVHIYYHCAVLLLFRPFIRLRINGSPVLPRDLYSLQRSPSFLPYLTLISATIHLTAATVEGNESLAATATAQSAMLTDDVQHVIATVPLDLRDLASAVGCLAAQGKMPRSKLASDVTDALRQGISDLTDMVPYNLSAKGALETLEYLCKLWTDGGAASEAQQQQAQSLSPFSSHVHRHVAFASGLSWQEAGFTMF